MTMIGVCSICSSPAAGTCPLCGRLVCAACSDPATNLCVICSRKQRGRGTG
jgi:hypothetical protein